MIRTVYKRDGNIRNRVAPQNPVEGSGADTFLRGFDKLARNSPTFDFIDKLNPFSFFFGRHHINYDMSILPATAGLGNEFSRYPGSLLNNRLFVGNLRSSDVGFQIKFPSHAIDDNI